MNTRVAEIYRVENDTTVSLPLYESGVSAGFPSPAEDFAQKSLDLNEHLIKHPAATYFVRVQGASMQSAGIFDGDLLVVDKALEPWDGCIVIADVSGEFVVKRLKIQGNRIWLVPENERYKPIFLEGDMTLTIWGVCTHVIHQLGQKGK